MTRRLQLVRKLRPIRLSVLPGVEMTVIGDQSYNVHDLGGTWAHWDLHEGLLIGSLRDAMAKAQIDRVMENHGAMAIARGVMRSKMGRQSELLHFDPASPC